MNGEQNDEVRNVINELVSALEDAHVHITECLQPEFENLAHGTQVSAPEGFTQEQALMRLATWWHGADITKLVQKGRSLSEPDSKKSQEVIEISKVVRTYMTEHGVSLWWKRPRHKLDGMTPEEVVKIDPVRVMKLAQDGRCQ